MTDLTLEHRDGLPDALRVLLDAYPRQGWTQHTQFDGLISFWLDRHLMFRRLLSEMQSNTEALLDRKIEVASFANKISRYGGQLVNGLHDHHTIEDTYYFPKLQARDTRIARGFDILDADHHALDGHLSAFVAGANGLLTRLDDRGVVQDNAATFKAALNDMDRLLNRHLTDEEDLVVPVMLKYGSSDLGG
ncbi:Hemerythrin HHE cation binding domain-containing protein [Loktanella fryxellensis]|uniref:Hemerythrin HHE cation binding domain-containing protein n=1 Tax=Loktanella fryxellensis TaxID=245187 RepID=A0A1H8AJJ3_9RHOB|nr:hemerythrin domain-containing protein [Loktanella fryxellensis]SEM70154.1 Hemerythrin HHE cation binding domain-containing protein [Loktanella fryxellensis]